MKKGETYIVITGKKFGGDNAWYSRKIGFVYKTLSTTDAEGYFIASRRQNKNGIYPYVALLDAEVVLINRFHQFRVWLFGSILFPL